MKPIVVMTQTHRYENDNVDIIHLPFIATEAMSFDQRILETHYDWLIFSSKNAVKHFLPHLKRLNYDKVAVIGQKTAEYCHAHGINIHFQPQDFSQEGFLNDFTGANKASILIPSSESARPLLHQTLRQRGYQVCKIDLYHTVPIDDNIQKVLKMLHDNTIDAMTFASSSAATAFLEKLSKKEDSRAFEATLYAIGKQTQHTIESYGYHSERPEIQTLDALIDKILETRE
ncbi:uroporphyrinogen-III synthase [Staphylococcus sp. 11262D007BW]